MANFVNDVVYYSNASEVELHEEQKVEINDEFAIKCRLYIDTFLSTYTATLNGYYSSIVDNIKKQISAYQRCFPLFDKHLGSNLSAVVFIAESDFWVFFTNDDVSGLQIDNVIDNPDFDRKWTTQTPEDIRKKLIIKKLHDKFSRFEILDDIGIPGGDTFINYASDYIAEQAQNHGRDCDAVEKLDRKTIKLKEPSW